MIIVAFSLHGLTAVLVLIAWLNRGYSPIRAKNLVPITFMLFAGILWCLGTVVSRGLIRNTGVWSQCKAWTIWVKLSFMYVFQSFLVFRTYALHRIFIQNKPCSGFGYYLPMAAMIIGILAFGIASQLVSDDRTVKYMAQAERCRPSLAFTYGSMAISWLIWICYTTLLIRIHNIRSSFNELRESVVIYLLGLINIIASVLLYTVAWRPDLHQHVRITSVGLDVLSTTGSIWVLLLYPVCMSLFNREEYLVNWKRKLIDDGVIMKYEMQHRQATGTTTASSGSKRYSRLEEEDDNGGTSSYNSHKKLKSNDVAIPSSSPNNSTFVNSLSISGNFVQQPARTHARFS
ncbi:hypothetical protein GGI12_003860, partial [Dipsacomyces acuminosporus]